MLGFDDDGPEWSNRAEIADNQTRAARRPLPGALCTLALAIPSDAETLVEETEGRLWEPEPHRVQAVLLLMQGHEADAEASLLHAIEVARHQQTKSWELLATTDLCRLWQVVGRVYAARQALAGIYGSSALTDSS